MSLHKYMGYTPLKTSCVLSSKDPFEIWNEIIDQIPEELLTKPNVKILNVACGYGTEAKLLAQRMLKLGVPLEQVRKSIWVLDKESFLVDEIEKLSGFENCITADFTTWETDMKFDIVVGNPPKNI